MSSDDGGRSPHGPGRRRAPAHPAGPGAATVDPRVERSTAAVVEAAVDLLLEGGTRAVTVEAIVARSGVARSTVYRHWASRADLVAEAFHRLIPAMADPLPDAPLRERLSTLIVRRGQELTNAPWAAAIPTLLDAAERDPELAGFRDRFVDEQRAPFRRAIQLGIDRGELPSDTDVDEAVAQLAGPLIFRRIITRDPIDAAFCRRLVELFLVSRGADSGPAQPR